MLPNHTGLNDLPLPRSKQVPTTTFNVAPNTLPEPHRDHLVKHTGSQIHGEFRSTLLPDQTSKNEVKISITSLTNDSLTNEVDQRQSDLVSSTAMTSTVLMSASPLRPTLPTLQISHTSTADHQRRDSSTSITSLARYSITSTNTHPNFLPRIGGPSLETQVLPPLADLQQTLPPFDAALTSPTSSNAISFSHSAHSVHHLSPSLHSPYGPTSPPPPPIHYTQSTAATTILPHRFPVDPASWRTLSTESSNSASSDPSRTHSLGSCPSNAQPSPSQSVDTLFHDQDSENGSNTDSDGQPEYDTQGVLSAAGYQCVYPGCVAPPFQTQYLLNSHTNVHSNQRPHFCPVEGCPRGVGGQGFKRKNEMIRHGLVHQSPGYVCPFCPDQQHKYPRPDNLQRHVRVHHIDRDKDDQALRDVLAQRPEGGSRGRRRRMA